MTNKKESVVTLVFGILSLAGASGVGTMGISSAVCIVFAIISLVFSKKALAVGSENKMVKVGKILAIIGLVLSIIGVIGGIICAACTCGAAGAASVLDSVNY